MGWRRSVSRKDCIIPLVTVHNGLNSSRRRPQHDGILFEPIIMAGQMLGAQVIGKVQVRNAKEVFWEIVSVDQHVTPMIQHPKAGNKRPGNKSMPTAPGVSRSVSGVPAFIDPRQAGRNCHRK
jgi:hypothetical protein